MLQAPWKLFDDQPQADSKSSFWAKLIWLWNITSIVANAQ